MKLRQIVCDKQVLTLKKENKKVLYGEVFEIEDRARAREILSVMHKGKPVAEIVVEEIETASVNTDNVEKAVKTTRRKKVVKTESEE